MVEVFLDNCINFSHLSEVPETITSEDNVVDRAFIGSAENNTGNGGFSNNSLGFHLEVTEGTEDFKLSINSVHADEGTAGFNAFLFFSIGSSVGNGQFGSGISSVLFVEESASVTNVGSVNNL